MKITKHRINIVTSAGGAFTGKTAMINGYISALRYVVDGTSPLTNTGDITVAGTETGQPILTTLAIGASSVTLLPRAPTCAADQTASLYAAAGEPVEDKIPIAGETLTITVANAGATKVGTLFIYVEED